jgi:general stress protein YciG
MDASKQREIASRGGRTAHAQGTAHKFSPDEAREAGRKGGKAVSGDRSHMARIGRRGGQARHARSLAQGSMASRSSGGGNGGGNEEAGKNNEKSGDTEEQTPRQTP